MKSGNWWEFYFIRYFVGSILGALIVLFLSFHSNSSISEITSNLLSIENISLKEIKGEHFAASLVIGVAFCYISSVPILVFHSLRGYINFREKKKVNNKAFKVISLVAIYGIFFWYEYEQSGSIIPYPQFIHAYILFIWFQLVLYSSLIKDRGIGVFDFYKKLAKDRSNTSESRKEYTESYRHLREHGNAFFILFCEVIFGGALFVAKTEGQLITMIFIWILPAIPVWFVGSFLESKLRDV